MTVLQDLIKHLPLIEGGNECDTDLLHVICTSKESYEEWRLFYEEWCKGSPSYDKEDDFSKHLLETYNGYSLYALPEPNMTMLLLPNGNSYIINSVSLCEWY